MSRPTLPPPLDEARRHADATRVALREARAQYRAALAHLAAEIRAEASARYGSVDALCGRVEDRAAAEGEAVPARTVRNALYQTFVADHLERCLDALAAPDD